MQTDGEMKERKHDDVPCAALQVIQQQVADLKRWQKDQADLLKDLKEMLGASILDRKQEYFDLRTELLSTRRESVDRMDKLLFWMIAALATTAVALALAFASAIAQRP